MAAVITTTSSAQAKTNINSSISTSSWTDNSAGTKVQNVSLTELQSAISKLSTYVTKVSNCGNCYNYTVKSTSCQSTSCQSTGCQSCQGCQTCQATTCQSTSCQKCQYCQYTPYYNKAYYNPSYCTSM